jgi:hypothetical protein
LPRAKERISGSVENKFRLLGSSRNNRNIEYQEKKNTERFKDGRGATKGNKMTRAARRDITMFKFGKLEGFIVGLSRDNQLYFGLQKLFAPNQALFVVCLTIVQYRPANL